MPPFLFAIKLCSLKKWMRNKLLRDFALRSAYFRTRQIQRMGDAQITRGLRLVAAAVGGALFAAGAQFARGCTSGAALSGMAVLSAGGIITMMAIFGTGYAVAYFFRKLWL